MLLNACEKFFAMFLFVLYRGRKRNISMPNIPYSRGFYACVFNIHFPIQQNNIPTHCDILYSFSFIASIQYSYTEISKYSIFFVFWKTIFNIQYSASSPEIENRFNAFRFPYMDSSQFCSYKYIKPFKTVHSAYTFFL